MKRKNIQKKDLVFCIDMGYSMTTAAEKLGISLNSLSYHAKKHDLKEKFRENFRKTNGHLKKVVVTNANYRKKTFDSMKQAAKYLGITPSALSYRLDNNKFVNGFKVSTHKETDQKMIEKKIEAKNNKQIRAYEAKTKKVLHWNEELEASFRKCGYYDDKILFQKKQGLYPYGRKVN